jgi:IS30 family transposase
VAGKTRIGDGEIDTVIGKGHSGALVTIVERMTKFPLPAQVNSKSAADVTLATNKLLKQFRRVVHSTTADNGKEFASHERISNALSADFFCSSLQFLGERPEWKFKWASAAILSQEHGSESY